MKRMPLAMIAAVALLTIAGRASAGPIELRIDGSELDVDALGRGSYSYTDYSMGSSFSLNEGGQFHFNFGHVDLEDECWILGCKAWGGGEVELTVELSSPILDDILSDTALFGLFSKDNDGVISLLWGDSVSIGYSYNGASGGLLSLNMRNIGRFLDFEHFEGGIDLWGTITNLKSPVTAVPEPGVLLLLGGGLLAFAAVRHRKAMQP